MKNDILEAKRNLEQSRTKFPPKNIIKSGNLVKINGNLYVVKKSYIQDNIIDFKNVMLYDYKGQTLSNFLNKLESYTIYYEVTNTKLIAGIYDINTHKKETKTIIINNSNPLEAVLDSGYIYSAKAEFFKNLLGNH